jgi:hypothetical protein
MKDIHINDINIHGYYITADEPNIKVPLEPQERIELHHMNLIELVLPKCVEAYCNNNLLTELIIPEGLKKIWCSHNQLTKLTFTKDCQYISCQVNNLSELIISNTCEVILCFYNNLTKLIIPKSCKRVHCNYNKLHPIVENLLQSGDSIKIQLANNLQK